MNLTQLRYFYEVARQNGFSSAARRLKAQQPTVSRAVGALETQLGTKLFERSTRTIRLTPEGERLYEECRTLFELLDKIPDTVRNTNQEFRGYLQFGVTDSATQALLPQVLKEFSRRHPKLIVSVETGPGNYLFRKIESGELEFGILLSDPPPRAQLSSVLLAKAPSYFAVLSSRAKDPEVLNSFIAAREFEDGRVRDSAEGEALHAISKDAEIRFSANSYMIHKALVLGGLGISIFPEYAIATELREKKLTLLNPKKPLMVSLNVLFRNDRPLSARAQAFIETFRKVSALKPPL